MQLRRFLMLSVSLAGLAAAPLTNSYASDINISVLFDPPPVAFAPPPLPVYYIPSPPDEGYLWMPGHWRWDGYDYFWVPGAWVMPPRAGLLWTPGYWEWQENRFGWHEGYWARHVGYYGGIHYGGGYDGYGFHGGGWDGHRYRIDRRYTNVTNVTNITNVTNVTNIRNVSFSGGPGGVNARPRSEDRIADAEAHVAPTPEQVTHVRKADADPDLSEKRNHGRPHIAATERAGDFTHAIEAKQAGERNLEAEKHNEQVREKPELAHGAAIPAERPEREDRRQHGREDGMLTTKQPGVTAIEPQVKQPEAQPRSKDERQQQRREWRQQQVDAPNAGNAAIPMATVPQAPVEPPHPDARQEQEKMHQQAQQRRAQERNAQQQNRVEQQQMQEHDDQVHRQVEQQRDQGRSHAPDASDHGQWVKHRAD